MVIMVHFVNLNEKLFNLPPSYLSARAVFPVLLRGIGNWVLNCSCDLHWESAGLKVRHKTLLHLSHQNPRDKYKSKQLHFHNETQMSWGETCQDRVRQEDRQVSSDGHKSLQQKGQKLFPTATLKAFIFYPCNLHTTSLCPNCPAILWTAFYVYVTRIDTQNYNAFHSSNTNTDPEP